MPHAHPQSTLTPAHNLHRWEFGLIASAAAAIAAPYVLPLIGIGDQVDVQNVINTCSSTKGGLAQAIEGALSGIPTIGQYIGTAGWTSSITSGVIGIAGILIGDYVHRHYDRKGHIPWGKVIKYVALTTSILIALPSILSGVSMGVSYIACQIGGLQGLGMARDFLGPTLGFSGLPHTAPTGLAGLLPHLFTCGRALLPMGAAALFANHSPKDEASITGCSARIAAPCNPIKGQPCEVAFQLIDNETGRPLEADELETVHTRKLHTMIVDSSLSDYHHLHPTYDPHRHLFTCQFTPQLQTSYAMWNDFTVKGETSPTHTRNEICLIRGLSIPPRLSHATQVTDGELTASISSDGPLRTGQNNSVRIDICDALGNPVRDLEPIMGAYAHLAAFSADGQHFIHTHPMGPEPQAQSDRGSSPLSFHVNAPVSGGVKFFLQVARGGRTITLPFGQMVAPARTASQHRVTGAPPLHTPSMAR